MIEKIDLDFITFLYAVTHFFVFLQGAKMFISLVRETRGTNTTQEWIGHKVTIVFFLGLSLSNFYLFFTLLRAYNGVSLILFYYALIIQPLRKKWKLS